LPHLQQRGRQNRAARARAIFCCLAVRMRKYSGVEVARHLGIGAPSVSRAVQKGARILSEDEELKEIESTLRQ